MSSLDFMGRIAEGKIQEAIEEGKFDNLPGRGKPIVFDDDPLTPPHLRMVNRILRNANVLPEWMQIFRDIESERKQLFDLRNQLVRENHKWRLRLAQAPQAPGTARQYAAWHAKSRAAFLRLLKSVNTSILKFTIVAPSTAQPIASYKVDSEMALFDQDVPCRAPNVPVPNIGEQSEGRLRKAAAAKYRGGDLDGRAESE